MEDLRRTLERFRPVYYLHSEEDVWPCNADYYLQNAQLMGERGDVLVTAPTQADLLANGSRSTYIRLTPGGRGRDDRVRRGSRPINSSSYSPSPPIYGIEQTFVGQRADRLYVTYVTFFCRNGAYDILLGLFETGAHDADIEHVTVEINRATMKPTRYYYGAHGSDEGTWWPAPTTSVGPPLVYIALHGHGNYARTGVVLRFFGFGNDHTDQGHRWDPHVIAVLPPSHPEFDALNGGGFVHYQGDWEPTGISGVPNKAWFSELPVTSLCPVVVSRLSWTIILSTVAVLAACSVVTVWRAAMKMAMARTCCAFSAFGAVSLLVIVSSSLNKINSL